MKKRINKQLAMLLSIVMIVYMFGGSTPVYASTGTEEETAETSEEDIKAAEDKAKAEEAAAQAKKTEDAKQALVDAENAKRQQEISQINSQIEQEKARQAELSAEIKKVAGQVSEKQAVVSYIDSQITNTRNEIGLLESKISLLETDIDVKLSDIEKKIAEYDKNYALFLDRLRAMYMYDSASTLGLVLGTDSYVNFLTTTDNINRVAAHDEEVMAELNAERKALEEEKKALEATQADLAESSKVAQEKRNELGQQQQVAVAAVQEVSALQAQFEKNLADSKAKSQQMLNEVARIYEQIKLSEEDYIGGAMAWPVPGYKQVTSEFGWRFGGSDYHTGMDISGGGVHGKPVVAANDGEVVFVNWSHSPGVSYGMYVMVDHGGGIVTLYAHLSNIYVAKGDKVSRGDSLGAVGSTGWSTGPHLHFEVQVNKKAQNPRSYVS